MALPRRCRPKNAVWSLMCRSGLYGHPVEPELCLRVTLVDTSWENEQDPGSAVQTTNRYGNVLSTSDIQFSLSSVLLPFLYQIKTVLSIPNPTPCPESDQTSAPREMMRRARLSSAPGSGAELPLVFQIWLTVNSDTTQPYRFDTVSP